MDIDSDEKVELEIPKTPQDLESLFREAAANEKRELRFLTRIWATEQKDDSAWRVNPDAYRFLARRFFDLGNPSWAIDVTRKATVWNLDPDTDPTLVPWPNDIPLNQTFALALAHSGATQQAQDVAMKLYQFAPEEAETLGILARTFKDQAFATDDVAIRGEKLSESLRYYKTSYDLSQQQHEWEGINVAFCCRLLNREREASEVADEVFKICRSKLDNVGSMKASDSYWLLATLAEARFYLSDLSNFDDLSTLHELYRDARAKIVNELRHLVSTRRQLRRLIEHEIGMGRVGSPALLWVDQWLPTGKVAMFVGHMIDGANRDTPRFPEDRVDEVRKAIGQWIKKNDVQIGYASAACGSDILFHEQVCEHHGKSRVVLPYAAENFRTSSVDFAGPHWTQLFSETLDASDRWITVSQHKITGNGIGYEYANMVLEGLAMTSADRLDTQLIALAVWDGKMTANSAGGTRCTVERWQKQGITVDLIDPLSPAAFVSRVPAVPRRCKSADRVQAISDKDRPIEIRSILFGDAVGFSQFSEEQVTKFVSDCIEPIAAKLRVSPFKESIIHKRTTGDGFYLVFRDLRNAGNAALDICQFLQEQCEQQWGDSGLPPKLTFRLALHTGPIHRCDEPFNQSVEYTGTHVSRAARLEPETPAGQVYASEAFAAIWRQQRIEDFHCSYVKQLKWAKHYGTFPTYVVTRAS